MPFNGSGGTSQPAGSIYPASANTLIESAKANTSIADLYTMLAGVICKDGQTTTTLRIPFALGISNGSQTITALADGTATTHAATVAQVRSGAPTLLGTVAGTNTITAALTPALAAYASGNKFILVPAATNTGATTLNIDSVGAKNIFSCGVSLRGGELVATIPVLIEYDGTQFNIIGSGSMSPMVDPDVCNGRLTLTSGTPVTTADVTAAETIYFAPFIGNKISLYTGATWKQYTFAEISGDVPDVNQMNDVFVYDNAGTLTLDIVAWTNDTTRATALTTQDGVLVKTGATGRRYVGSFYSTTAGNGQTEDSFANRYVWNYYNRVDRPMRNVTEGTDTWTYTTAAFRQANANTANQLNFVIGVSEDRVEAFVIGTVRNDSAAGGANMEVGIGLDATNALATGTHFPLGALGTSAVNQTAIAMWRGLPAVGKHYLAWLEKSTAAGTSTWTGDIGDATIVQSGISGSMRA